MNRQSKSNVHWLDTSFSKFLVNFNNKILFKVIQVKLTGNLLLGRLTYNYENRFGWGVQHTTSNTELLTPSIGGSTRANGGGGTQVWEHFRECNMVLSRRSGILCLLNYRIEKLLIRPESEKNLTRRTHFDRRWYTPMSPSDTSSGIPFFHSTDRDR